MGHILVIYSRISGNVTKAAYTLKILSIFLHILFGSYSTSLVWFYHSLHIHFIIGYLC